jgi:hypothetical protein
VPTMLVHAVTARWANDARCGSPRQPDNVDKNVPLNRESGRVLGMRLASGRRHVTLAPWPAFSNPAS